MFPGIDCTPFHFVDSSQASLFHFLLDKAELKSVISTSTLEFDLNIKGRFWRKNRD
jgi:hypothetical protein